MAEAHTTVRYKGLGRGDQKPLTVMFQGRDFRFIVGTQKLATKDWDGLAKGPLRSYLAKTPPLFTVTSRVAADEPEPTQVELKATAASPAISVDGELALKRQIEKLQRELELERSKSRQPADVQSVPVIPIEPDTSADSEAEEPDAESAEAETVVVMPRIDTSAMGARQAIKAIQDTDLTIEELEAIAAAEQRRSGEVRTTVIKAIEDKTLTLMEAAEKTGS